MIFNQGGILECFTALLERERERERERVGGGNRGGGVGLRQPSKSIWGRKRDSNGESF